MQWPERWLPPWPTQRHSRAMYTPIRPATHTPSAAHTSEKLVSALLRRTAPNVRLGAGGTFPGGRASKGVTMQRGRSRASQEPCGRSRPLRSRPEAGRRTESPPFVAGDLAIPDFEPTPGQTMPLAERYSGSGHG